MRALPSLIAIALSSLILSACGSDTSSGGGDGGGGGAWENPGGTGGDWQNPGGTGGDDHCSLPGPIRGSCRHKQLPTCFDFTGTLDEASQRLACEDDDEGVYSSEPCDRTGAQYDGGCLTNCGSNTEIVIYMYEGAFVDHKPFCLENGDTWIDNGS